MNFLKMMGVTVVIVGLSSAVHAGLAYAAVALEKTSGVELINEARLPRLG